MKAKKERRYWSIRVDKTEANGRPRWFFDTAKGTNAAATREGEDDYVYVLYDSERERDDAIEAYDVFRTAHKVHQGPFDME